MSHPELESFVAAMTQSYAGDPRGHRLNRRYMPSKEVVAEIVELCLEVFFPGYFGRQDLTDRNLAEHLRGLFGELHARLVVQIEQCLCHAIEEGDDDSRAYADCAGYTAQLSLRLLGRLPALRAALLEDMQAALEGDPAAHGLDEVILAYPGFLAVAVHRVAHELYEMGVPLMPRMMSEWAHSVTGCDIHPGATIGHRFFIDHATGTVVGETSVIGDGVKLYQGVTLGALSHPRDASGRVIRNVRRHPTVEDDVTIYANATVLGGTTVVGRGSVVGGSVFVTKSVAPASLVSRGERGHTSRPLGPAGASPEAGASPGAPDFDI
ncbi:MAG TPA: serine O-acetyltransferase [Polyangiaceae bacterium]|nr:serine O-acetyltransferase [Polyangiaceae bacterium]